LKEYYAPDIDERTVDIILKFGVYYNEAPRFSHKDVVAHVKEINKRR
jgi:hypothetical protein